MAKQHIFAVFAASLLTCKLALGAASVALGPEVPLSRTVPALPVGSDTVATAVNGSEFLLVWSDQRAGWANIWATRVDSEGHPTNPLGNLVGIGSHPRVVPAGSGFLIVWHSEWGTLVSVLVDSNGNPTAAPKTVATRAGYATALLTTGLTFLLIYDDFGSNAAALLDSTGALLRKFTNLPLGVVQGSLLGGTGRFMGAAVRDGRYLVAARTVNPPGQSTLYTIADDGTASGIGMAGLGVATFGAESILLLTESAYSVVSYDGRAIKPQTPLPVTGTRGDLAGAWDGHEFLAVFSGQNAFRIASDGTLNDAAPFALSPNAVTQFGFAAGPAGGLAAWNDTTGTGAAALVGRAVRDFDALAAVSSPPLNLALAPEPELEAQVAVGGETICGVWDDLKRHTVYASFNGATTTLDSSTADFAGWPAVAAGNRVFLVVWRKNSDKNPSLVLAQRFDFAGHPLDKAPIVLDTAGFADRSWFSNAMPAAIAFDGSSFLVTWGREPANDYDLQHKLYTARIGEEGPLRDRQETLTTNDPYDFAAPRAARVLWTGSRFVVVHTLEYRGAGGGEFFTVKTIHFDPANASITRLAPSFNSVALSGVVGATLNRDRVTYAWLERERTGIYAAQTNIDGTLLIAPREIVRRRDYRSSLDIAWDGFEYVVAWLDPVDPDSNNFFPAMKLRAIHVDRNLDPIESVPFDVFSGSGPLTPPRLIPTSTGVLIVYSRSDVDTNGAARAFVRTLPPVARRQRAAH